MVGILVATIEIYLHCIYHLNCFPVFCIVPPECTNQQQTVMAQAVQSTEQDEHSMSTEAATAVGVFEVIDMQLKDESSMASQRVWSPPVTLEEWATWFDSDGRLVDMPSFREKVFYGGLEAGGLMLSMLPQHVLRMELRIRGFH